MHYSEASNAMHYIGASNGSAEKLKRVPQQAWRSVISRPLVLAAVLAAPSFGMFCACFEVVRGQYRVSGSVFTLSYCFFLFWTCYLFSDRKFKRMPGPNLSTRLPPRKNRRRSVRSALLMLATALSYAFSSCICGSTSGIPHVVLLLVLRLVQSLVLASLITSYLGYAGKKQILAVSWISSLVFALGLIAYVSLHQLNDQMGKRTL